MIQRAVDRMFAMRPELQFLLLAICCLPLMPTIFAYGLWLEHWPVGKSGHPAFDDLSNLWLGAKAALAGDYSQLFRRELHEANIAREFGATLTNQVWSYPPTMMALLLPLALLPNYASFCAVWTLGGLAAFIVALRHRETGTGVPVNRRLGAVCAGLLLVPGVAMVLNFGQTGFFTAGVLYFGIAFAERRPMVAGALIGLLVAKPHLGLAVPVVFLALGAYRAIAWTAFFSALYLAATYLILGAEPWQLFLSITVADHVHIIENVAAGPEESLKLTVFQLLRTLGASSRLAMAVHVTVALAALAGLYAVIVHQKNANIRFLAAAFATLLVSPYLLGYELVLVALAAGRTLLDEEAQAILGRDRLLALMGALTVGHMVSVMVFASRGVNTTALLVMGVFAMLAYDPAKALARKLYGLARLTQRRLRPAA